VKWARLLAFGLALLSVGLIVFIFGILYCYPSLKPNFFADVLWTLALFAITAGIAAYAYLRNRNILFTFFDIDQHDPLVAIYVSNILIMPKGAWALEQTKEGYAGPAVVKVEYEAALEIQKLLTADKISLVPEQLRDWFDRIYFRNRRLEVNITFSERTGHTFPTGTTTTGLTIGDFG
jgi:hypothetical protein